MGLSPPVAVVCHDAGAANLILPWISEDRPTSLLPVMEGPAAALWEQRFGTTTSLRLDEAIGRASSVLTGTGWQSDLEHRARKLARMRTLRSVAVIDHWVNYRQRFSRDGVEILPDEIWVTDDYAASLAEEQFPELTVSVKPNLYLEEQVARAGPAEPSDEDVLFVMEPLRTDWERGVPGEFQALDYFVRRRDEVGVPPGAPVRVRPHPSDPRGKYDRWIADHPGASLDASPDLASALAGARWVVGCESYALVVAMHAGRRAISALPPWAPPCRLPHDGIVHLARI